VRISDTSNVIRRHVIIIYIFVDYGIVSTYLVTHKLPQSHVSVIIFNLFIQLGSVQTKLCLKIEMKIIDTIHL